MVKLASTTITTGLSTHSYTTACRWTQTIWAETRSLTFYWPVRSSSRPMPSRSTSWERSGADCLWWRPCWAAASAVWWPFRSLRVWILLTLWAAFVLNRFPNRRPIGMAESDVRNGRQVLRDLQFRNDLRLFGRNLSDGSPQCGRRLQFYGRPNRLYISAVRQRTGKRSEILWLFWPIVSHFRVYWLTCRFQWPYSAYFRCRTQSLSYYCQKPRAGKYRTQS